MADPIDPDTNDPSNDTDKSNDDVHKPEAQAQRIQSLRITVPLNMHDTSDNTFSYSALAALHARNVSALQHGNASVVDMRELETGECDTEADVDSKRKPQRKRQKDSDNEYDYDDDFIDDGEMFDESVRDARDMPQWDYGFFVWHGSVEHFFDQQKRKPKVSKKRDRAGQSTATGTVTPASASTASKNAVTDRDGAPTPSHQHTSSKSAKQSSKLAGGSSAQDKSSTKKPVNGAGVQHTGQKTPASKQAKHGSKGSGSTQSTQPGDAAGASAAGAPSTMAESGAAATPKSAGLAKSAIAKTPSIGRTDGSEGGGLQALPDQTEKPASLQKVIQDLETKAAQTPFDNKKQFPGALVPLFKESINVASNYLLCDDAFYTQLSQFLPYSVTVLKKLGAKLVNPARIERTSHEVKRLYDVMRDAVALAVEAQKNEAANAASSGGGAGTGAAATVPGAPVQFRWEDSTRAYLWNILCLEWELADIDNQQQILQNEKTRFTETSVRRTVYLKIESFFPKDMMDTNALSREYSKIKNIVTKRRQRLDVNEEIEFGGLQLRRDPFYRITAVRNATRASIAPEPSEGNGSGAVNGTGSAVAGVHEKKRVRVEGDEAGDTKKSKVGESVVQIVIE